MGLVCLKPGAWFTHPVEGVWGNMKNGLGNLSTSVMAPTFSAVRDHGQVAVTARSAICENGMTTIL